MSSILINYFLQMSLSHLINPVSYSHFPKKQTSALFAASSTRPTRPPVPQGVRAMSALRAAKVKKPSKCNEGSAWVEELRSGGFGCSNGDPAAVAVSVLKERIVFRKKNRVDAYIKGVRHCGLSCSPVGNQITGRWCYSML